MERQDRIQVAVQKSGRLTERSLELLERCGLQFTKRRDQLSCFGENMPVDILLVRDDEIPGLVQEDICDLGIVGLNTAEEKRFNFQNGGTAPSFQIVRSLDFGHCRLSLAVPEELDYGGPQSMSGLRVATSYPGILRDYFERSEIDAEVVPFSGAVEIAPRLGKADAICDLVSSGNTLVANKMREETVVMESEAVLIQTPVDVAPAKSEWMQKLNQRIEGVLQVRESKYVMLHAPRSALAEITRLLPGAEAPTVIPLEGGDKVAVHVVCRETVFWETLEDLKRAGASSVLVLPVEKMLA